MENTKPTHTPGPWGVHMINGNPLLINAGETLPKTIVVEFSMDETPNDHANAKLIAAAPELLEALQELQTHLANADLMEYLTDGVANKMRAAIKKATE